VGPFGVEVLEGLRKMRIWLDENEWGVAFDVTFEGAVPAILEPKQTTRQFARITMDTSRYAQVGCYSGSLVVGGESYTVSPDRWKGVRDHSWGVRPVGDPEPPGIRVKVQHSHGFFHNWMPMQFDDFMLKVFFEEDENGDRFIEESAKVYNIGLGKESELMGTPRHDFTYKSGTRELETAVINFAHPSGKEISVTNTPLRTVYLAAGSGYIPQPDWVHGMYQGELKVEGKTYDLPTAEERAKYGPLYETLSRYELSTGQVGYGLLENLCVGTYHPHGFADPGAQAP